MAHTKSKGSTSLGRDSQSKRLGVKLFAGETAKIGNIIIRQRGTKFYPGLNVKKGKDDTLYAIKAGKVKVTNKKKKSFHGSVRLVKVINVIAENTPAA